MRSLTKTLLFASLLGVVTVYADTPAPTPGPDPATNADVATLSASEMVARVLAFDSQIKDDEQHVQQLQNTARKDKDVIKLACVNSKLLEVKAEMNIFDSTNMQFQGLLGGAIEGARASFTDLVKVTGKIKSLRGDADGCAGVPELYKQESGVEVHHPEFPDNPLDQPFTDPTSVEPPGYASPFA